MSENIFFDPSRLKRCGKNVIIGRTVRIRYPELVEIGDDVIIDDFTYISTALEIESLVHIAAGCKIIGGRESRVVLRSFSTLAPNVVLSAGSDDYIGGIATPLVERRFKGEVQIGRIELGRHCIVGAGSVVLPNVVFADGASLGALSLARCNLEPWTLYAGIPARRLRERKRDAILELEAAWRASRAATEE